VEEDIDLDQLGELIISRIFVHATRKDPKVNPFLEAAREIHEHAETSGTLIASSPPIESKALN